jgi:hypothetical protein
MEGVAVSDKWFVSLGVLLALGLAVIGVYAWGLLLDWWSL